MPVWMQPIDLENSFVRLTPLQASHCHGLNDAAADGALWNLGFTSVPRAEHMQAYIEHALQQQANGLAQAFAVLDASSGRVLGSTRYCNIDAGNRRLEIGYTWYRQSVQRSGVNTGCKQLLLQHAFEQLNASAVEFRTHWLNHRSRAAIARLGAKQDGVLRQHMIMADGSYRDTVVFSILNSEWPAVKSNLQGMQARHAGAAHGH